MIVLVPLPLAIFSGAVLVFQNQRRETSPNVSVQWQNTSRLQSPRGMLRTQILSGTYLLSVEKKVQIFQFCPSSKMPNSSHLGPLSLGEKSSFFPSWSNCSLQGEGTQDLPDPTLRPRIFQGSYFQHLLYLLSVHLSHLQGSDTDRETDPTNSMSGNNY